MSARAIHCVRVLLVFIVALSAGSPVPVHASSPLLHNPPNSAGPTITLADHQDVSRPLVELTVTAPEAAPSRGMDLPLLPLNKPAPDPLVSRAPEPVAPPPGADVNAQMPAPLRVWDGIPNRNGVLPPDTNGDVGPNHYVQWVNLSIAIWDKQGRLLYGPTSGNALWSGFGGPCQNLNDGDPIVLYDSLADRWFVSQFALPGYPTGYYQCVAVSQTPDPTGSWYRYAFRWSTTLMNDYGKFGVWPDGYYFSVNQFDEYDWAGAGVAVLERDKMLQGLPARMLTFNLYGANPNFGGMLPADLDGQLPPPAGAPNPFVEWDDAWVNPDTRAQVSPDELRVWNFHVDWNQPGLSTFGNNLQPNFEIPTANVTPQTTSNSLWITQPNTAQKLDALSDRLMYRLQYRSFGDHQTLVGNHTVDADGNSHAGIHWFELRSTDPGTWALFQQGVYAPDTVHRWMASLAMDGSGNMALGYSLSNGGTFPSIAYSGRLAGDPAGAMPQSEMIMTSGAGSQTSTSGRWGDYSTMSVDPVDDCTFWYTQEVLPSTSWANWRTKIGSFRFPDPACTNVATGILLGRAAGADGTSIAGVAISLNGAPAATTDDHGNYRLILPPGSYTISASVFSYTSAPQSVSVSAGQYTHQDFSIPLQLQSVSGTVRDASGHAGMPLFARVDIPTSPQSPVYTDPSTGRYQVSLPAGMAFAFTVSAVNGGYQPASRSVTPGFGTNLEDFNLSIDAVACSAPGYAPSAGDCQTLPGGMVVGIVQDANQPPLVTPKPIVGATVRESSTGASAVTGQNPAGEYSMFLPEGSYSLYASYLGYGGVSNYPVAVRRDAATRLDFNLPAGHITASATTMAFTLQGIAPLNTFQFTLHNDGILSVNFQLNEIPGLSLDPVPTGPFAQAGRRLSPKRMGERSAASVYEYVPPGAPAWPGGASLLQAWPVGLPAPWGLAVVDETVWVSDVPAGGGDGRLHALSKDGQRLSGEMTLAGAPAFLADLAYDPARGRLWQVAVNGEACLVELDPAAVAATGGKICPDFGNTQRGLAYDPISRTFFSGTWNDAILSHFDASGQLLDSTNLGINIAGIALHPGSQRLYILSNAAVGYDVYVVEARLPYRILGGFDIPELANFGQAGLDFSPDGHLWVVDSVKKQVLELSVGEAPFPNILNVPWLNESLTSGSLGPGQSVQISVSVNPGLLPGVACASSQQATLTVTTDSPYDNSPYRVPPIPVTVSAPCLYYFPRVQNK